MEGVKGTWSILPEEMKYEVLAKLTQNRDICNARLVCKKWRDVVDEVCERSVTINSETDLEWVSSLRIKSCTIDSLVSELNIFRRPELLQRLNLRGSMNVTSFWRIMNGCAVKLQDLCLSEVALEQRDLIPKVELAGFKTITNLEANGSFMEWPPHDDLVLALNASTMINYQLPQLSSLVVRLSVPRLNDQLSARGLGIGLLVSCLEGRNRLKSLHAELLYSDDIAGRLDDALAGRRPPDEVIRWDKLAMLRLTSVTIVTVFEEIGFWTPFLDTQSQLKELKLEIDCGNNCRSFMVVELKLFRYAKYLTSVELNNVASRRGSSRCHLLCLQQAVNLKKICLRTPSDLNFDGTFIPANISLLPTMNIQEFEIVGLWCSSDALQLVINGMDNLKRIVLRDTGSTCEFGVHGGIVLSVANKCNIQSMDLIPVNHHCSVENEKLTRVLDLFEEMVERDRRLIFNFERFRKGLPQENM